jgi:hypothetical protein
MIPKGPRQRRESVIDGREHDAPKVGVIALHHPADRVLRLPVDTAYIIAVPKSFLIDWIKATAHRVGTAFI